MNRGYNYYFKKGFKKSAGTFVRNKNLLKYFAYYVIKLLCSVTLFFIPVFQLADIGLAKHAKKEEKISVFSAIRAGAHPRQYWNLLFTGVLKFVVELVILLGLVIVAALFAGVGIIVANLAEGNATLYAILFALPMIIVILGYLIFFPAFYRPVKYILATNPTITFGEAFHICYKSMRKEGFFTYWYSFLSPLLIAAGIVAVDAIVFFAIYIFTQSAIIAVVWLAISVIAFILFMPMVIFGADISRIYLLEDVILDPINSSKDNKGLAIKRFKSHKVAVESLENHLVNLFDATQEERKPIKDLPQITRNKDEVIVRDTPIAVEETVAEEVVSEVKETPVEEASPVEEVQVQEVVEQEEAPQEETTEEVDALSALIEESNTVEQETEETPVEEAVEEVIEEAAASVEETTEVQEEQIEAEQQQDAPVEEVVEETNEEEVVEETNEEEVVTENESEPVTQATSTKETKKQQAQQVVVGKAKAKPQGIVVTANKKPKQSGVIVVDPSKAKKAKGVKVVVNNKKG